MLFTDFLNQLRPLDPALIESVNAGFSYLYESDVIYHGGDINNLKSLLRDFKILTPDEKRLLPSTGGGNVGLSATRNVNLARRYSSAFGHNKVLAIRDIGAVSHGIDTNGDGIDMFIYGDNGELRPELSEYDSLVELDNGAEEEIRILNADKFKPIGLV